MSKSWTTADLAEQVRRFESELRAAGKKEQTIRTYVDRAERFVRWLDGDYDPSATSGAVTRKWGDGAGIEASLGGGTRSEGQPFRVFVLSRNTEEGTIELGGPIANTTKATSGRPFAWTMSQRYTRLAALTTPGITTTSELESVGG